jgi:hypothetical protein
MYAGDGPAGLIMGWENELCERIVNDAGKGFTMFPGENSGNITPVGIDGSDVTRNTDGDGGRILRIIVCIDYTSAFSRDSHQTSYIWEIDRKNADIGFTHIRPGDGIVQPNDLLWQTDPSLPGRAT